MRFIHIADVHLGISPDEGKPWSDRRKQDIWDSFAEVTEIAKEEKIEFLFIAGDLFQRQPLQKELKELNYFFGRIPKTKVVFIAGNHDYVHPNSYYRTFQWSDNVTFLGEEQIQKAEFKKDNVCVYGLSYWHRELSEPLYDNLPLLDKEKINILLLHGGDAKHIPFSPEKVAAHGFDYTACGHIHKGEILLESKVIMAGALEPTDANNTGQHGYWMGEVTKLGCIVKFYPIRKCEYVHMSVAVNSEMTDGKLQEKIAEILTYAEPFEIYKFILSGRKSPEIEFNLNRIASMEQVCSIIEETVPDYDFEKLKETYDGQMIGRFIKAIEQEPENGLTKKALYYGVDALCRTMR